jgi:hypothetical protein
VEALQDQLAKAVKLKEWDIAVEMEESLALVKRQIAAAEKDAKKKGFGAKDRRKIKKEGKLAGGPLNKQSRIVGWSGRQSQEDVAVQDHGLRFKPHATFVPSSFSSDASHTSSHASSERSSSSRVSSDGRRAAAREAPEANDLVLQALAEEPEELQEVPEYDDGGGGDGGGDGGDGSGSHLDRRSSSSSRSRDSSSASFASNGTAQAGDRMLSKRQERHAQKGDLKKLREAQKAALAKEKAGHKAAVLRELQEHRAALAKEKDDHQVMWLFRFASAASRRLGDDESVVGGKGGGGQRRRQGFPFTQTEARHVFKFTLQLRL